jgi:hypothetical protein
MADDLDNLALPYDYGKGEAPGGAAPTTSVQSAAPAPVDTSHPELDNLPLPYKPGEQPGVVAGAGAPPPKTWGQTASDLWNNTLLGRDKPPVVLQPRSLSQAGADVGNFTRVAADQAAVPGAVDNALSALPAWMPFSGDIDTQRARTKAASDAMDESANNIARFIGQRASVTRLAGPYADNPMLQGAITGGGGTLMHGGSLTEAATNAAADTGLSALGEAAGTAGAATAKELFDRSTAAVSDASTASLEHLQDLWKRSGDVAGTAEQYATAAKGAVKDAYQKVAEAASQSIDAGPVQRFTAGAVGSYLPGVGPLASAYIADPAIKAYNQFSKGVDVSHAIDSAYPEVSGAVKTVVDPQTWRNAIQNFAVSAGPTGSAGLNAIRNFSPTSWARALWPGSS